MSRLHSVQFTKQAKTDLMRLDKAVATRVVRRIQWLTDNLDSVALQPLTAQWASFYKLRVGDYRVLYRLEETDAGAVIFVEFIRHRREVYK